MANVHLLGIRHHGPGSARSVLAVLAQCQPAAILIEGPADAQPLLAQVDRDDLALPIALMLHSAEKDDSAPAAAFYPFAEYSPEWQALRHGQRHGIPVQETLIAPGKWTPACGAAAVSTLLARGARFSALVASNDDMAIGAIKQLHECGVSVPEQVSVVGFDDIALAPYVIPSLASVKMPVTEMIQETISRLITMVEEGEAGELPSFSGKLVRRDSLKRLLE